MKRLSRLGLALSLSLVAVGLSACSVSFGGSDQIDHKKAESLLRDNFKPTPTSVTCPSGIKIKKGGTFDCTVKQTNGRTVTVTVHMTNSSGHIQVSSSDIHANG